MQALKEGLRDNYNPDEWFMQGNAPIHTALRSREWLEVHGVAIVDWSPCSPDLNPIEHLWWALKRKPHKLYPDFDTMCDSSEGWEQFEMGLEEAWAAIPDTLIRSLIKSMPRRLNAVAQENGYLTNIRNNAINLLVLIYFLGVV